MRRELHVRRDPVGFARSLGVRVGSDCLLLGTNVGTWAWAHHSPMGLVSLGNPPSGIAGGYCFLDMVGIYVAARLARVHAPEVVLEAAPEPSVA